MNLGKLRALAKRLKTQQELAYQLWETDDSAARLLAVVICRPKAFERDELDAMLREARPPKVHDWLVNYVVKKSPHAEELRLAWYADRIRWSRAPAGPGGRPRDQAVRRPRPRRAAGHHRGGDAGRPGPPAMGDEPLPGRVGIEHAEYRARAVDIGERLGVLKNYPTSPDCTTPSRHLDRRDGAPAERVTRSRPTLGG